MELFKASRQWAERPADERFSTVAEMHAACAGYRRQAAALEYAVRTAAGRYGHTRVDCAAAEAEAAKLAGVGITAEGRAKALAGGLVRGPAEGME